MELLGIGYLRNKLATKRLRVLTRYKYYEMKNITRDFKVSTPPELLNFMQCLGWCGKAVDSMADRLRFKGLKNDYGNLAEIFSMNNPDVFFNSIVTGALISSCCFIYVSADEEGFPRLQVIDGSNATGNVDPITNFLTEGYAVLERDKEGNPTLEAYFVPGRTDYFPKGAKPFSIENPARYPALVPVIYRPDAKRAFGHSRISRAAMSIQDSAVRTVKRSEIASEFYSYPQKYITGLSDEAEIDNWKASMSSMLALYKDEDGESPKLGQFTQQSIQPFVDQLKMFAGLFGGETGLTMDDLGFVQANPSSAEAIKSAHENLRMACRKAQDNFSSGIINAGIVAASFRDGFGYFRKGFYRTKVQWYPVFEPDFSALSLIGDGAIKLNQAIPDFFTKETLSELTGIDVEEEENG